MQVCSNLAHRALCLIEAARFARADIHHQLIADKDEQKREVAIGRLFRFQKIAHRFAIAGQKIRQLRRQTDKRKSKIVELTEIIGCSLFQSFKRRIREHLLFKREQKFEKRVGSIRQVEEE